MILSIPGKELPAIIGLAEVENRAVLEDLVNRRGLRRGNMRSFMRMVRIPGALNVPCSTGRNCSSTNLMNIFPIEDPVDPDYLYRGILHVNGTGPDGSSPSHLYESLEIQKRRETGN